MVGSENLNLLAELKALDQKIEQVNDLAGLGSIYSRLDEIARQSANDFEVQLAVGDIKQRMIIRGTALKEGKEAAPERPKITISDVQPPPPPPTSAEDLPTVVIFSVPSTPAGAPLTATVAPQPIAPATSMPPVLPSMALPPAPPWPPPATKRTPWMGIMTAVVVAFVGIAGLMYSVRQRLVNSPGAELKIVTVPAGASVRIDNQTKCTSDCSLSLPPGKYQISAVLDGYEPAAGSVTLAAGQPVTLNLALAPQHQTVRILTDFAQGGVVFDRQPSADLQDGRYVFERAQPGQHTVTVSGPNSEVSFSFELAPAKAPSINGTVMARNALAVLVASFASQARVVTSSGPWRLAVNGQKETDAGPAGVDLKNFQTGVDEFVIAQGNQQSSMKESFSSGPILTVFLKMSQNNRPEGLPVKTAVVKKGPDTRVKSNTKAASRLASLQIQGGTPGAEVLIDQRSVGTVASDGRFEYDSVAPGEHVIELARPRFVPKRLNRSFRAGEAVTISGAEALLTEPSAEVVLPAGRGPLVTPPIHPPEPRPVEPMPVRTPPAPTLRTGGMADFENPTAWRQEDGVFRHRGEAFLPYKMPARGVFVFNVHLIRGGNMFRGGRIRWAVDYADFKNYALFELDAEHLAVKDVVNGRTTDHMKLRHNVESKQKVWAIQIEVSPDRVVHRIQKDGQWAVLHTRTQPGRNFSDGKFGFWVQGNDEIGLSNFTFTPR